MTSGQLALKEWPNIGLSIHPAHSLCHPRILANITSTNLQPPLTLISPPLFLSRIFPHLDVLDLTPPPRPVVNIEPANITQSTHRSAQNLITICPAKAALRPGLSRGFIGSQPHQTIGTEEWFNWYHTPTEQARVQSRRHLTTLLTPPPRTIIIKRCGQCCLAHWSSRQVQTPGQGRRPGNETQIQPLFSAQILDEIQRLVSLPERPSQVWNCGGVTVIAARVLSEPLQGIN
ncbi:hypothetical protein RRG08_044184 [Elysia crispata]|uniref:Uncharacterized protein n=1 Tax=Elysia crispata TaxID=231223 RepID=A0AAE1CNF3_9GAST|nr:hypothetical protein RRG08_044184 [Elysia crispata]